MKRYVRCSSDEWQRASDPVADVRKAVAKKTNDEKLLWKLSDDWNWGVRLAVAKKTNDDKLLQKLSDDEIYDVREAVALRTNDENLLWKLADDESWAVRKAVARKTNDKKLLWKLSDDEYEDVREAVRNKTSDKKLLTKLAKDTDRGVEYAYSTQADLVACGMNYNSAPHLKLLSRTELSDFQDEFKSVEVADFKPGLYVVQFYDETFSFFKVASSMSDYEHKLKSQYESGAPSQFEEYGDAELYLFFDWYELTVEEDECPDADAFVNYCKEYIEDTYVDRDSFASINLVQVDSNGIRIVLSGQDTVYLDE